MSSNLSRISRIPCQVAEKPACQKLTSSNEKDAAATPDEDLLTARPSGERCQITRAHDSAVRLRHSFLGSS